MIMVMIIYLFIYLFIYVRLWYDYSTLSRLIVFFFLDWNYDDISANGNFNFFSLICLDLHMPVLPPKLRVYSVSLR